MNELIFAVVMFLTPTGGDTLQMSRHMAPAPAVSMEVCKAFIEHYRGMVESNLSQVKAKKAFVGCVAVDGSGNIGEQLQQHARENLQPIGETF